MTTPTEPFVIYMTVEVRVDKDGVQFSTASVNDPSNCIAFTEDSDAYDLPKDQYEWFYKVEEELDAKLAK